MRRFIVANLVALAIAWLAAFCLGSLLQLAAGPTNGENITLCAALGVGFGQASALATWLAFGPLKISIRLLGSLLVLLIDGLVLFVAVSFIEEMKLDEYFPFICAALAQFVLLQLPLWLLRFVFSLRIVEERSVDFRETGRLQFGVRHMLLTMSSIAVVLAAGRFIYPKAVPPSDFEARILVLVYGLIVGCNLLLAWAALWAFYSPSTLLLRIPLAIALAAGTTFIEHYVYVGMFIPADIALFIWINLFQYFAFAATFLATRRAGYELVRLR